MRLLDELRVVLAGGRKHLEWQRDMNNLFRDLDDQLNHGGTYHYMRDAGPPDSIEEITRHMPGGYWKPMP